MRLVFLLIITMGYLNTGWTLSEKNATSTKVHAQKNYKSDIETIEDVISQYNVKEIIQDLIDESISSYPGPCPCPYSKARNGSLCGKRSAYSKEGGYEPLCYPEDITQGMIIDAIMEDQ